MATMMESDIDQFIQNQKAKLQQERQQLADDERGERVGRRQWDEPGRDTQYAEERVQDSSRKAEVDYKEWERSFQKEKQKDYNDYLEQMKHRSRKQATPPGSGLKFGEFEEYRKKIDRQRKQDYKEELKKQQEEQMLLKAQRDYVNVPFIQTSPRIDPYKEKLDHEISDKIMNQKFKEFDKMMALNKKHDQQNLEKERLEAEKQYRAQKWKEFDENLPPNPPEQQTQSQFERPSDPSHYHNTYSYQKHQQQLKEEREKETRQFFEQRGEPQSNRKYVSPKEETGLQLGKYEDKRKKLEEERKREYNEMLAKKTGKRSKAAQLREERAQAQAQPHVDERPYALTRPQVEESPFSQVPVTAYAAGSDTTRQLQEEKEREYYDLVSKLQQGREDNLLDKRPVDQGRPFSFTANEKAALTMLEEKEREYQQLLKERQEKDRESHRDQLPPKAPTPGGMFNKLGAHDRQREKLNEERKQEYNKLINEGDRRGRGRGNEAPREIYQPEAKQLPQRPSTDEGTGASLKGLNPRDSAEIRKKQLRNEEYNEFLRQKGGNPRGRQTDGKPPLPLSAKNPRHRYNDADPRFRRINSATSQRENQKKEDIYASLPGLHYSDSADRSDGPASYEEVLDQKRQQEAQYRRDDPSLSGLRPYNSEGALNTLGDDRYNELDREYESRKVRFRDQRSNILENDQWLDVDEARRDAEFRDLQQAPAAPRGAPKEEPPPAPEMATSYFATLPVGGNERDSAKRRRQDKYREELQLQMQEAVAAKRREKLEDLRVNATGLLDPEKSSKRLVSLGNPEITPRRNIRSPEVQPYHTKFDLSPRSGRRGQDVNIDLGGGGGYEPRERGRRRERGGGILTGGGGGGGGGLLDNGFDGLLESRPRIGGYLPPGIQYQPSTYITGGGGVGNPALSSIDEAYHFYGMRNPLEPEGTGGTGGLEIPLNRLDDAGFRDRMSPPRVTFDDNTRTRSRSRDRISPYQFPSDDDYRSKSRQGQKEYQIELERQIQEKRYRDQKAKEEKERYEKKLEEEIRNYNPFGRGGGGAPIKDAHGNAITDLRSMHYDNTGGSSARSPPPRESPRFRAPSSPKDDLLKPPPVQQNAKGEATFARGGHGIFGHPRTDAEKDAADKYKDDLKRQIEDKKRQEQIEREKERIEEEKENRRLEEQRLRIQKEYDEELRRKKEKEEEARKKNEELRQQAEDRKKEEERKRRADADAKSKERQEEQERERLEKQRTSDGRGKSPPIPSYRRADEPQIAPAPTPLARANSSDVLKELATMRKQLQSERKRVENALENQKNEPDVFDPRMVQRPPPREIDVFERAKQGHAAVPQRTTDTANPRTLQEFNELKYKTDTDSRRAFRSMFPDAPTSNSALESQQDALLRHQEDTLKNMKERRCVHCFKVVHTLDRRCHCSCHMYVDGVNHFPEDFEDLPKRNESARLRRRERIPVSPRPESLPLNPLGSTTSLDVDKIQRKNDARLRRLHQMNTDDVSIADPDDILDRFMAKQRHNRPPSGQTLQDDSWLRPGSKAF